jgi:hypothetical protein
MERKYTIAKSDYWVSLKNRAKKEKAIFDITVDEFYSFLKERNDEICSIANQNLAPYITRIENLLPYKLGNLKVEGKPRIRHAVKGTNTKGESIEFSSFHAASKMGFCRTPIINSIEKNKPYKEYLWQYI